MAMRSLLYGTSFTQFNHFQVFDFFTHNFKAHDGFDVIEWVAQQSYCTGKVGTYGGSYPGIVQWQAMSQAPPHLYAAAPEMTPIGSHQFIYYGGAFSHPWLDWFVPYIIADKRKRANDKSGPWDDEPATEEWVKSDRKQWYNYRPLIELPILKKYAPEYYEWLKHPDLSSWWDFVNMENDFIKFRNPVFLESGWYDAAYGPEGATRAFNKIRKESATDIAKEETILMLGPWNHTSLNTRKTTFGEINFGLNAGIDYDASLLRWYDILLKDDLKKNTEYNGYRPADKEIVWFWNILFSLTRSEKAAFLQFATGSSKVPLAGFSELPGMRGVQKFSICKASGPTGALMSAHTCFNALDLPVYNSEEEMREKLLYAINETKRNKSAKIPAAVTSAPAPGP